MRDLRDVTPHASGREPWNKGKLIGAKPPLRRKHVWSIRTKLQLAGRTRDLAIFNLAIDSKLRGCDIIRLRVEDVAPHGHAVDRATARQMAVPPARYVCSPRGTASSPEATGRRRQLHTQQAPVGS